MLHFANVIATGEDSHDTIRQLMVFVHAFNASRSRAERVAVAFPAMLDAIMDEDRNKVLQLPRCGAQMRLFGAPELVQAFLLTDGPARLVRLGAVVRSAVQPVPGHAAAVRFVRDRRFEKTHKSGAYFRRQQRRAAAAQREAHLNRRVEIPQTFSFELSSLSTARSFHLDVRRESAQGPVSLSNITAYGLCGEGAAVPLF